MARLRYMNAGGEAKFMMRRVEHDDGDDVERAEGFRGQPWLTGRLTIAFIQSSAHLHKCRHGRNRRQKLNFAWMLNYYIPGISGMA